MFFFFFCMFNLLFKISEDMDRLALIKHFHFQKEEIIGFYYE